MPELRAVQRELPAHSGTEKRCSGAGGTYMHSVLMD